MIEKLHKENQSTTKVVEELSEAIAYVKTMELMKRTGVIDVCLSESL